MNLFDVTRGIDSPLAKGSRPANDSEIAAYMHWQRAKLNLPDMSGEELHFAPGRNGKRHERGHCIGATFGGYRQDGGRREYENGSYSILMPGHDAHRATVTMETLDDAGEVLAASTMPIEPKKGGVIWSKDDVRKAAGPIAKPRTGRKAKVAPQEAAGAPEALSRPLDAQEPVEALGGADLAPAEPSNETCELPGDPVAALVARMEALEARLAALSVESAATPTVAKRTPAHERAIRRAWAERKARRTAAIHLRIGQVQYDALKAERDALEANRDEWEELQHRTWLEAMGHKVKRRRAVLNARNLQRRLYAECRLVDRANQARHKLRDELEAARRTATYIDGAREAPDIIAQTAHHARIAIDSAEPYRGNCRKRGPESRASKRLSSAWGMKWWRQPPAPFALKRHWLPCRQGQAAGRPLSGPRMWR